MNLSARQPLVWVVAVQVTPVGAGARIEVIRPLVSRMNWTVELSSGSTVLWVDQTPPVVRWNWVMVPSISVRVRVWLIPVPLPVRPFDATDADLIRARFIDAYTRFFGRAIDGLSGLEIEIVTISVKASDKRAAPEPATLTLGSRTVTAGQSRNVFDPSSTRQLSTGIIARESLTTGDRVAGPAVVVERETATVVTAPFDVVMQSDGSLLLVRKEIAR